MAIDAATSSRARSDEREQVRAGARTLSGEPVRALYTAADLPSGVGGPEDPIGQPGAYPYTRGPYESMYRGRLWTMRQFAGFGTSEETNARFHYLLDHGQTGLSTAFDMPSLMGHDSDHPRSLGEVGREGVALDTLEDMLSLFAGIDLGAVSVSMTINAPAAIMLAYYVVAAELDGDGAGGAVPAERLSGTIQADILKEYIAQKEWCFPIDPAMRLCGDMIEWCTRHTPRWHPISISGYHIREAGATAQQELAFTLADGLTYVRQAIERGLDVDDFAPRLSFFFNAQIDLFEEIAKYRAARRIWARELRETFHARNPRSWLMRFHCQTAGVSLTAQQPLNNIVRTTIEALAGVLGGTQSLHTNSYDEALALPTEDAVRVALRTQQIVAHETGVAATADPLGGSYYVEALTDQMERRCYEYFAKIDQLGGMVAAVKRNYPQREIADAAFELQRAIDSGERVVVGVNRHVQEDEEPIPILRVDPALERKQLERLQGARARREGAAVERSLAALRADAAQPERNLMPALLHCARARLRGRDRGVSSAGLRGLSRDPSILSAALRRALIAGSLLVVLASAVALSFGARRIAAEDAAYSAPAGPQCVPSRLNRSAVLPGTSLSVSPLPDSLDASSRTQISLLGVPVHALGAITVRGSRSGPHRGRLIGYSQGDGASFVPARPFTPGETVTVHGRSVLAARQSGDLRSGGARTASFAYQFTIAQQDTLTYAPPAKAARDYNEEQHFLSAPALQPPVLAVTASAPGRTGGDLFAAPYQGPGPSGPEIFADDGELIWFHPLSGETAATNLQVQSYAGRPVLTWWQGRIPPQGFGQGEEVIYSTSYTQIGRAHAGNGYEADLHDFHITPQGTALLTVFDPIRCDLASVGGPAGGAVTDSAFQEIDLATGLVRREWHSLDHVGLRESYSAPEGSSLSWPYDYFHINSLDQLAGGVTLISARNTWALYELGTATGQVWLRVGGRLSDVRALNGAETAYQHDATALPNGTVTVFDNGAVPRVHPQSRAIVLAIDPHARTDTLVARYEQGLSAGSQGNVQTLAPSGDLFVGWGSEPYFSEFSPAGQLLYGAHWRGSYQSYRAYRFPWSATPAEPPALALAGPAAPGAPATVRASWNGATGVASWRVLAGPSPAQLTTVASAPKSGFETAIALPDPTPADVAVQALDATGAVLGTSATIAG